MLLGVQHNKSPCLEGLPEAVIDLIEVHCAPCVLVLESPHE